VPELTPDGSNELPPTGEQSTASLGRYKILGELGRGGCGIVYRALDPSIGRVVAIKTILAKTESSAGRESRERFRREARSAGNLSHPNIVTIHDFSDTGDPMFIAMEFVEGRTLAEAMSSGSLAQDFVLGVLRSAADALDYAHAHHIVHRDVKPANFLITANGRLKITDFGIAKILDGDDGLTNTGVVVGTAQYMSPEQISETNVTGRSDQFSLAVIAYEMLAGVKPFQGNSWASVIHAIIMAEPPPIPKYRDSLGDGVNTVLRKALSKDPQARYGSCAEFCNALEQGIVGAPPLDRTVAYTKEHPGPSMVAPLPTAARATAAQAVTNPTREATREVLPETVVLAPPAKASSWMPVLIGAVSAMVIVGGGWVLLRSRSEHPTAPVAVTQPGVAAQNSVPVAPPQVPSDSSPKTATPSPRASESTAKQLKEQTHEQPPPRKAEPSNPPSPPPTIASSAPAPPVATPSRDLTPTPVPVSAPVKAQEDQANKAAEEQAKRLADEQAKRASDEQARRAMDEQARRLSDEQARNARNAESAAISRALRDYQGAYERKDLTALQAIWPSIPKTVLDGIRGSFRDASEVSMDLHAVGDPKVTGNTATVMCDRNLRQVIHKRAFQASGRVRVVLSRSGSGWMIQSVDSVNP
jgi:serine/threonine protein kinase